MFKHGVLNQSNGYQERHARSFNFMYLFIPWPFLFNPRPLLVTSARAPTPSPAARPESKGLLLTLAQETDNSESMTKYCMVLFRIARPKNREFLNQYKIANTKYCSFQDQL